MATVYLAPTIGVAYQGFLNSGLPNNAGTIDTFAAGTSTPTAVYTTSAGTVAHAQPIVLGTDGRIPAGGEVWLIPGQSYKFVFKDSLGNALPGLMDNIYGIGDPFAPNAQQPFLLTGVAGTNTITAGGPVGFTYLNGQVVTLIPANTTTGATTVNVTPTGGAAQGAKNVFFNGGALTGGELKVGVPYLLEYDGTQYNIISAAPIGTPLLLTGGAGGNTITAGVVTGYTYSKGSLVILNPAASNTGPVTVNLTPTGGAALGAKNLFNLGGALVGNELTSSVPELLEFDGTQFNLLSRKVFKQPTRQVLTSGVGATYTTGLGATRIFGRMVGGGAGGGASAANNGANGNNTTFSTFTAGLGNGGVLGGGAGGAGGTAAGGSVNIPGGQGGGGFTTAGAGTGAGGMGGSSAFGGAGGGGQASGSGGNANANSGSGGGGGGSSAANPSGGGGGSGGYVEFIIINPAATYTYTIGTGGAGGAAGGFAGGNGAAGIIIVDEYFD